MIRRARASAEAVVAHPHRFRLHRAGVLNVWQYDDQVFEFADGRMLLRGANGAGKSKTLEMLLPFVLDGDKNRITASGRHHTSLLWLMTDGYDGSARVGYLWVEFLREAEDGSSETFTCGVGVRASQSARAAGCWYFTTARRIGTDLHLEDESGPLPKDRCRALMEAEGQFFEQPRAYKHHVGQLLFGLDGARFDELLRLLYWLRQPQVGEDIEPARLASILSMALPELDDESLRSAGDTFDELAAFGEEIDRRQKAAAAVSTFAEVYGGYARALARSRAQVLLAGQRELRSRDKDRRHAERDRDDLAAKHKASQDSLGAARERHGSLHARLGELQGSQEARDHERVLSLQDAAQRAESEAGRSTRTAERARERVEADEKRLREDADSIGRALRQIAVQAQASAEAAERAGGSVPLTIPAPLVTPAIGAERGADRLETAIGEYGLSVQGVRPMLSERRAAVNLVDQSRRELVTLEHKRVEQERAAADADRRTEQAHGHKTDAEARVRLEETGFLDRLADWRQHPSALVFDLPEALTAQTVPTLPGLARAAAQTQLESFRETEKKAASTRILAERELESLRTRRTEIVAERDPAPAPPPLARSSREGVPGAPLWRLIDFDPSTPPQQRAVLEAALEASGLLDAWVCPDGEVLDSRRLDVVLPAGPTLTGRSLGDVLRPDVPADCDVSSQVVRSVLGRVRLADMGSDPVDGGAAAVSLDGRWWLGVLIGRSAKDAAQYVGATARAAERSRRLAEVDIAIAEADARRSDAAGAEIAARQSRRDIETWLDAFPAYDALVAAWTTLDERIGVAERADAEARTARDDAERARSRAAEQRRILGHLADTHGLPTDADGLARRLRQLEELDQQLARSVEEAERQITPIRRWQQLRLAWGTASEEAATLAREADELRLRGLEARERSNALLEAVGASVRQLQEAIGGTTKAIDECSAQIRDLESEGQTLGQANGAAGERLKGAERRCAEQEPVVVEYAHALAALTDVPGLLLAVQGGDQLDQAAADQADAGFELARGAGVGSRLPRQVVGLADRLAVIAVPERRTEEVAVWQAAQELATGPAADAEPRVVPIAGALAVLARDDAGEHPVTTLATRLAARVAQDQELLTDRERQLFEDHILGDLGEALRLRRLEAEDLVAGMNRLLDGVSTSQGVRVTLDWRLRDDVGEDVRRAVSLLGQPVGALLPDERRELRDAMHRLIDASRAEEPELSYTEHLTRCLDYRQWFVFRIRYTRPETPGKWSDLHRRSALSQGEQKVVCYLPLFAAAAAHFTSVAGAAPHAPRFVLLDDAFPKIDIRTHPLLFGLLVDLDLDFVVTSERLWGDHDTVPSLSIYEALRDPAQRGIAQYRHTWDGQRLRAVGA